MKKLHIFDFDGTCVYTMEPEVGKKIYLEKTGEMWPFNGWWGRPESLNTEIFHTTANSYVKGIYDRVKEDPNSVLMLATGRTMKCKEGVEKILDLHGYKFSEIHFNNSHNTLHFKLSLFKSLVERIEPIEVHIYDDRGEHVSSFREFVKNLNDNGVNSFFYHIQ